MKKNNYPFTSEEVRAAYETSVVDLAQQYGYTLKAERDVYHVKGCGGLYIWQNGLGWYCHSTQERGNNVDFLIKYCGVAKKTDAIRLLLSCANITPAKYINVNNAPRKPKGEIKMPERFAGHYNNLYWYLMTKRHIDKDIVYRCLQNGSIYQDIHRNVVFCGKDNDGIVRYASLRGTYQTENSPPFKGEVYNSDKRYGFTLQGKSDRLFVFEAPIDAMSHATLYKLSGLDWKQDTRLALGGTSDLALEHYLSMHDNIKQIIFCLDNDYYRWDRNFNQWRNIGQDAVIKHAQKYSNKYIVGKAKPALPFKDWNEYLTGTAEPQFANECKLKAQREFAAHGSPEKYYEFFPQEQPAAEITVEPAI